MLVANHLRKLRFTISLLLSSEQLALHAVLQDLENEIGSALTLCHTLSFSRQTWLSLIPGPSSQRFMKFRGGIRRDIHLRGRKGGGKQSKIAARTSGKASFLLITMCLVPLVYQPRNYATDVVPRDQRHARLRQAFLSLGEGGTTPLEHGWAGRYLGKVSWLGQLALWGPACLTTNTGGTC